MKYILLTQGYRAVVDDNDYDWLSKNRWYYKKGYAVRQQNIMGKQKTMFMHRLINATPDGMDTDHINRNKLDNRRSNLRSATRQENVNNTGKRVTNKSGVKGVCWHNGERMWRAQITKDGKKYFLGRFDSLEKAAQAYSNANKLSTD